MFIKILKTEKEVHKSCQIMKSTHHGKYTKITFTQISITD